MPAPAESTDPEAFAVIADIAREWRHTGGRCAVRPALASASLPRTEDAVRELWALGCERGAVAPCVPAPGFLPDRIARGAQGTAVIADVLGAAPAVAAVVLSRFREAASAAVLSRIA